MSPQNIRGEVKQDELGRMIFISREWDKGQTLERGFETFWEEMLRNFFKRYCIVCFQSKRDPSNKLTTRVASRQSAHRSSQTAAMTFLSTGEARLLPMAKVSF